MVFATPVIHHGFHNRRLRSEVATFYEVASWTRCRVQCGEKSTRSEVLARKEKYTLEIITETSDTLNLSLLPEGQKKTPRSEL